MSQSFLSICWPAIVQLYGDPELIFFADAQHYTQHGMLHHSHLQPQDRLIDSNGAVYAFNAETPESLVNTGSIISLQEMETLLQLHLSDHGNVCISKFHAKSIREAIASVFNY